MKFTIALVRHGQVVDGRDLDGADRDVVRGLVNLAADLLCPVHGRRAHVALDVADRTIDVAGCCSEFREEVGRRIEAHLEHAHGAR